MGPTQVLVSGQNTLSHAALQHALPFSAPEPPFRIGVNPRLVDGSGGQNVPSINRRIADIAVLPVILFHVGLAVFSGGFVGVDVFFVISGYLITGIILRELGEGHFSVLRFYGAGSFPSCS